MEHVTDGAHRSQLEEPAFREAYDILCDVRGVSAQGLSSRFAAAGFDDVPQDALSVLGAMHLNGAAARVLLRHLGITSQAASQSLESLIKHGYLEFRDDPDNPRLPMVSITDRGHAVLDEAENALRAARWADFPLRPGDIIISTVPKSGTTWVQTICALLIFQRPRIPAPLPQLSPLLDAVSGSGRNEVYGVLAGQRHRRFIKSHMPLFELPADSRVTYIVVARHPLDTAISFHHHKSVLMTSNALEQPIGKEPPLEPRQWILNRIDEMANPPGGRDGYFNKILRELLYAWQCRTKPNVVLVHYQDLSADLPGEMRRLAERLDIVVPEEKWPSLVKAATFDQMRTDADRLQPLDDVPRRDTSKGFAAFFRRGASGDGRALLTAAEVARYDAYAANVAPREFLTWLHRDGG